MASQARHTRAVTTTESNGRLSSEVKLPKRNVPSDNGHIRREYTVVVILMWEVVYVCRIATSSGSRTYEERSKRPVTWITMTRPFRT